MPCSGRYAEAWEFSAFFCVGNVILGADDSGAQHGTDLTDSAVNFVEAGVRAGVGMMVWNLTDGSSGLITAVSDHTLTAVLSGSSDAVFGNTWDTGDLYRVSLTTIQERSTIEHHLDITAADIQVAVQAQGACECDFSDAATALVKKLNIIEAASFYM